MMKYYIKEINVSEENGKRKVAVTLNDNSIVRFFGVHGRYNCDDFVQEKADVTSGIAELYNEWLNGGKLPEMSDVENEKNHIVSYWIKCHKNEVFERIDDFDERLSHAIYEIDRTRRPLRMVDYEFESWLYEELDGWCSRNGYRAEDIDMDLILF